MKILLIGEYSRLHNSLKEGLVALGHTVTLAGLGDYFKNYPLDYSLESKICSKNGLFWFFNKAFAKLNIVSLEKWERAIRFYFFIKNIQSFDYVQLINSDALELYPIHSRFLYKKLFEKIKTRTLLVCGDEPPVVKFWLKETQKYSVLTQYLADKTLKKEFHFSLKYSKKSYQKTFDFLQKNCQHIVATDYDYVLALKGQNIAHYFIPNPINTDILTYQEPKFDRKICIFLGINSGSYLKKGINFFEDALTHLQLKYPDTFEVIIAQNMPYQNYIKHYNRAHILFDQVLSYDQGYNALEAMAQGKVVFTGAEKEFLNHFNLQEDEVAINALDDLDYMLDKLSFLLENPSKIIEISQNARNFIEKEHNYIKIAQKYIEIFEPKN